MPPRHRLPVKCKSPDIDPPFEKSVTGVGTMLFAGTGEGDCTVAFEADAVDALEALEALEAIAVVAGAGGVGVVAACVVTVAAAVASLVSETGATIVIAGVKLTSDTEIDFSVGRTVSLALIHVT